MRRAFVIAMIVTVAATAFAFAAPSVGADSLNFTVPGTAGGPNNGGTPAVSTGIVLNGNSVAVNASGTVFLQVNNGAPNGPDGGNPGNSTGNSLVPNSPYGCLAARVGAGSWSCIGASATLSGTGEIQFGINDDFVSPGVGYNDNSGSFDVVVSIPQNIVTVTKTVTGSDPGVTFPVTVSCTSTPSPVPTSSAAASDAQITLPTNGSGSATVDVPAGGSQTVAVSRPLTGVANVTCTASENLTGLPAGFSCTPTISPASVVVYSVSDEIDGDATFSVTNACTGPPPTTTPPVTVQPNFTG